MNVHFIGFSNINQLCLFEKRWILQLLVKLTRLNLLKNRFLSVKSEGIKNKLYIHLQRHAPFVFKLYLSDRTCNKCHPNLVLHLTTLFKGALNAASSNSGTCYRVMVKMSSAEAKLREHEGMQILTFNIIILLNESDGSCYCS